MKRIIVIGHSIAAMKALESIRQADPQSELTVFTMDGNYPYDRNLFADYCAKKIKEDKLYFQTKDFYEKQRISVILSRQISRVNLKRKRISTEERDHVDFDILVIADTPQVKFPDIKGTTRGGVFAYRKLADFKKMISMLPLVETVVIEGGCLESVFLSEAIRKKGKEVILVVSAPNGFAQWLTDSSASQLTAALEEIGVRVIINNAISEILGDNDMKAIRLKSSKVIAGEMVIFTDVLPDLRVFSDEDFKASDRIPVDSSFKTNVEGVFAVGNMSSLSDRGSSFDKFFAGSQSDWSGKILSAAILGNPIAERSNFESIEIWVGEKAVSLFDRNDKEKSCQTVINVLSYGH